VVELVRSFLRSPSHDRKGVVVLNPSHAREQAGNAVTVNPSPHLPPSLSHEQLRRMLEEILVADPNLLRQFLRPLAGTAFPIVGGAPCDVKAHDVVGANAAERTFGKNCTGTRDYTFEADASTTVPLTVKGAASQSAD